MPAKNHGLSIADNPDSVNFNSSIERLFRTMPNFWVDITVPERLFGAKSVNFGRKSTIYRVSIPLGWRWWIQNKEKSAERVTLAARVLRRVG